MKENKNRMQRKRRKIQKKGRAKNRINERRAKIRTNERRVKSKRKTRVRRVKRNQGRHPG